MSAPVFLGYDREALDALYDVRRRVLDWETYTDRFEARGAETRARYGSALDVRYGPHERQRLDVFRPIDADGALPVHVFFHGGYWRAGDKERYSYVGDAFVPLGAAYVAVEYALIPDVDMDGLIAQCREAVAWVYHQADVHGLDRDRIVVSGHSAGGHIVGMLMAAGWQATFGVPVDVIRAGLSLSGLHDLEPIRETYLNDVLELDLQAALSNSPYRLPPATAAPLILATGELEGPEFARQTWVLDAYWRSQGVDVTSAVLDGHHHYSIVEALGDPASELARSLHHHLGVG